MELYNNFSFPLEYKLLSLSFFFLLKKTLLNAANRFNIGKSSDIQLNLL